MTVVAVTPGSVADVSHRLGHLVEDRTTMAQWWVELVAGLDELAARMMEEGHALWHSMRAQLTADAPHMSAQLRRIDVEEEALQGQVWAVRVLAGDSVGDPERAAGVATAVRELLHRLRRHEERTNRVLVDAYVIDLGGD